MKLFYLSNACFSDCEIDLLKKLADKNDISYGVLIHKYDSNYTVAELRTAFKNSNVNLIPIKLKYRVRDPRQIVTYLKLIQFVLREHFDVVYVNNTGNLYFNFLASLLLKSNNTIIGIHDVVYHSGSRLAPIFNFSNKVYYGKFKAFLTFSESQAKIMRNSLPQKRVFSIPLALKDFGPKVKTLTDDGIVKFLFFGNILSYKGLDLLLNATNELSKKFSNFQLIIAGRCADWDELYEPRVANKKYIVKAIRFIENSEIPRFFSNAQYLILPYKDVTQSGPLMIAYNYGIPVIASNLEGFSEFIESSKTGFLFDAGDENSLQKQLTDAVLRTKSDYEKLTENIHKKNKHEFSIDAIKEKYQTMFNLIY